MFGPQELKLIVGVLSQASLTRGPGLLREVVCRKAEAVLKKQQDQKHPPKEVENETPPDSN